MADAVKELVIKIVRDSAGALANQRAYYAAEKKGVQQSLTDAEVAEKAKTKLIERENNQRIQAASKATKTTVEQAKEAEKAKADAAKKAAKDIADGLKAAAQVDRQAAKDKAAAAKEAAKAVADGAKAATQVTRQAAAATKQIERDKVVASKQAAKDILASVKQQVDESEKLEQELFAEGKRLAAEQAAREKKDEQNSIASSRLAFGEKKKQLDSQTKATDEAAAATRQMTRTLLGTQVAGAALNMVKAGIDAIGQSAADAKARIHAMSQEAAAARHADREIAALTGNKATVGFSAAQAGEAAQAGVSPEDYRGAQLAFQAQAGQYIGDGELSKISQDDSKDLLQRVTSFSASQGIDAADPARLMGAIISKGKKGDTNDDRLATFAKAFRALQLAPGETSPLVGQLTELIQEEVGEGGTFNNVLEAVPLIRSMAERNPGEASTYGRSLIRGLREARMSPDKMAELGITKDMSFMEQVRAVEKSATAVGAAGGDESEFLSKHFKDIREFGAVRTALGGVRGKSPEMVQAEMAGVNAGTVNADIGAYRAGEEGTAQTNASREIQARLEQSSGPGMRLYNEARAKASASLESSGDLNKPEGWMGAMFTASGRGDRKSQETTALVGDELMKRLEGSERGRQWMKDQGVIPGQNLGSYVTGLGTRSTPESTIVEGFKVLAESQKDLAKAIREANPPGPPKVLQRQAGGAPPAGPGRP